MGTRGPDGLTAAFWRPGGDLVVTWWMPGVETYRPLAIGIAVGCGCGWVQAQRAILCSDGPWAALPNVGLAFRRNFESTASCPAGFL